MAAEACPEGKLDVRGRRRRSGRACSQAGRWRRNRLLTGPFTNADSTPRMAATRTAWTRRRSGASARPVLTRCQTRLKSPSSDAAYISRSTCGCPRKRSMRSSMAASKRPMARATALGRPDMGTAAASGELECQLRLRVGRTALDQRPGGVGVAAEGGAVRTERAPLAQPRGLGPEVLSVAGALDRLPHGSERAARAARRAIARLGDDGQRIAQEQQLHAGRSPAQQLLAQQRVDVD